MKYMNPTQPGKIRKPPEDEIKQSDIKREPELMEGMSPVEGDEGDIDEALEKIPEEHQAGRISVEDIQTMTGQERPDAVTPFEVKSADSKVHDSRLDGQSRMKKAAA